jgi:hypothetical protein
MSGSFGGCGEFKRLVTGGMGPRVTRLDWSPGYIEAGVVGDWPEK